MDLLPNNASYSARMDGPALQEISIIIAALSAIAAAASATWAVEKMIGEDLAGCRRHDGKLASAT